MALKLKRSAVENLDASKGIEKKHTILVVDDESENLRAIESALKKEFEVMTANDGQEALELIQTMENPQSIHLIISDQRMPRMTGIEFLKKTIPIISNYEPSCSSKRAKTKTSTCQFVKQCN